MGLADDVDPERAAATPATLERRRGGQPGGSPGWRSIHCGTCWAPRTEPSCPRGNGFMAERGNARIEEVTASHTSMVSQPEAVTRLILSAVEETSRSQS
jgi:hypothetical protein